MTESKRTMHRWFSSRIGSRSCALVAFSLAAALAPQAIAAQNQSLDSIRKTVKRFLTEHASGYATPPHIRVGTIDPRLRLTQCDSTLVPFSPPGGQTVGNVTVGVRCAGTKPWTLYVQASVKLRQQVVVLARPVPRGSVITAADIRLEERDIGTLVSGFMTEPGEAVGLQATRPLTAGFALNPRVVSPPKLIQRGQRVTLLAPG